MSERIEVIASKNYSVIIDKGSLKKAGAYIKELFPAGTAAIISEDTVFELYGKTLTSSLKEAGIPAVFFTYPHGETAKNMETVNQIIEFLAENHLTRTDFVAALGGGVTGDMAGFAAAVYLRGISYIQVPTTFLAAIDSSVGGKTGVNLKAGKNLAGAFHQPSLVICDYDTFHTLPGQQFDSGMAEAIKYGVLGDKELFDVLSGDYINERLEWVIGRCIRAKRALVMEDEFDVGSRQLLNLGHTMAHSIEKLSGYQILHGQAVGIGMAMVAKAAYKAGLSSADCYPAIKEILTRHNLPYSCDYSIEDLCQVILSDKKRSGDKINIVIPDRIGHAYLHTMDVGNLVKFYSLA